MSKTLLEIVQDILSVMGGEEVNGINDTEEAEQVARIVRKAYNNIVSKSTWAHTRRAVAITPRSDNAFPTHCILNENVKELISVFYNSALSGVTRKQYEEVQYLEPDDFLRKINGRNSDSAYVDVIIDDSGIELLIATNKAPQWYTSFDDENMVFDSYDSSVDDSLKESKFQAQGYIIPEFVLSDTFVPDLPPDAFMLLENEATAAAQYQLRQFQDVEAEKESTVQGRWLSRKQWRVAGGIRYPNYGRGR